MLDEAVVDAFAVWANRGLQEGSRFPVVAWNFNFYEAAESWDVELVGTFRFDPEDPDWACDAIYSHPPLFRIGREMAGHRREQGLASCIELVSTYLRFGKEREILRAGEGVAVGFIDGELTILWPETAA